MDNSRENPLLGRAEGVAFGVSLLPVGDNPPLHPEGVKNFKTGGDRESEAPAEPHGARICWGDRSPRRLASQFFHTSPPVEGNNFHRSC
ncbi:MAG: hypothetical protein DMG06_23255 [Acidobacteria bacterium]|nr:MAG: hypothetical protein DMG06_23255 [Acidobacteriota bacterium]